MGVPRISDRTSKGSRRSGGNAAVLRFAPRLPGKQGIDVFKGMINEDVLGAGWGRFRPAAVGEYEWPVEFSC